MVTDQKHSSDSIASKQEVIRHTKKLAQIFGLNEQNAEVYSALSGENRALKEQLEDYYSQHNTFEKRIKRLERDVKSLEIELEDLDECVDREAVVDLIHEIVPLLIGKKGKALSDSSEESDLVEIIEGPHRVEVREKKDVPHKQRRKAQLRRVKQVVV